MSTITSWLFRRKVETEPISDEEWEALFASKTPGAPWLGVERRHESRERFEQFARLFVDLASHGQHRYLVRTRDVSAMGVGFLHSQRIEPGKKCKLVLLTRDRQLLQRQAVIASCRKHDKLWMIGLRFDKPIDPEKLAPVLEDERGPDSSNWLS